MSRLIRNVLSYRSISSIVLQISSNHIYALQYIKRIRRYFPREPSYHVLFLHRCLYTWWKYLAFVCSLRSVWQDSGLLTRSTFYQTFQNTRTMTNRRIYYSLLIPLSTFTCSINTFYRYILSSVSQSSYSFYFSSLLPINYTFV